LLPIYASKGGCTLLDGELVSHLSTNHQMYLIFDIISLDGKVLTSQTLEKRLEKIGEVVGIYRNSVTNKSIPADHPFEIIGKTFMDKSRMYKLSSCIFEENGYRVYRDEKRYHKTDGIIFTPNEQYVPRTVRNMFKWKYVDEISIDLKVNVNKFGVVTFSCAGDRGIKNY
jgi:ATP-dependent DNA ligase